MSANYHHFKHQNAVLGYSKAGSGSQPLLIFHGFGQDHAVFNALVEELGEKFTLYSFDLFFHGQSDWPFDEVPLSKSYWKDLFDHFLNENKLQSFSLMGFSLGGKFALATLEAFPEKIKSIFFLAPDGIKTNFWYILATYPLLLRIVFKKMIVHPGLFLSFIKMARSLGLIDQGVIRFAQSQMDTEEKRRRVYYSWVVFRQLKFDMKTIAAIINANEIQTHIFIGKYDKIITASDMNRLVSKLQIPNLQLLDTGHNGVISQSLKILRNMGSKSP